MASETYSASTAEGHAIELSSGTASYENIEVYKTGDGNDSNGSEYYDWYGRNAAILATGGTLTITQAYISSDATYGSAVFAYGSSAKIVISESSIETGKKNSGGIMVTGGGTISADNLTITTSEGSSAAIRSDKNGGTITVNEGTYTANGAGSPAVYSTADITVSNAELNSGIAQGVVIEGKNSATLNNCTVNASHTTKNGQDSTYQAVMIYQSGSGDADEGTSSFAMTNGSITNANGDIFCVTNTSCTIDLTNVEITNSDTSGNFLRAEAQAWGTSGSNRGTVVLTASSQDISGNVIVDSSSSLTMTLKDNSTFTGSFNPDTTSTASLFNLSAATGGAISVTVEEGSKLTLTGNSYITYLSVADSSDIDYGVYTLNVDGTEYSEDDPADGEVGDPSATPSGSGSGSNNDTTNNDTTNDDTTTNNNTAGVGSSSSGCNAGYMGLTALLAGVAFLLKKKN